MISLTSLPREVFAVSSNRIADRCLVLRADDPDNKEVVLFMSEMNQEPDAAIARQIDTAVVTDRSGLAALAHAILAIALDMEPPDEPEGDTLFGLNGDGPW